MANNDPRTAVNDSEAQTLLLLHYLNQYGALSLSDVAGGNTTPGQALLGASHTNRGIVEQTNNYVNSMSPDQRRDTAMSILDQMDPVQASRIAPQSQTALATARSQTAAASQVQQQQAQAAQAAALAQQQQGPAGAPDNPIVRSTDRQLAELRNNFDMNSRDGIFSAMDMTNAVYQAAAEKLDTNSDPFGLARKALIDAQHADITTLSLRAKYLEGDKSDAVQRMQFTMSNNVALQNAATNAAQYGLESRKFTEIALPELMLKARQMLLNEQGMDLQVRGQQWKELTDVARLAFDDMTNQAKQQLDVGKFTEGMSQYNTNREDAARATIAAMKQGLAKFMGDNAQAIAQASLNAGNQFLSHLSQMIRPDQMNTPLPGFEPGGAMATLAKRGGYTFTAPTFGDTVRGQYDPFAPVQQLRQDLAGAQAAYPMPSMNDLAPPRYSPGQDYLQQSQDYQPSPLLNSLYDFAGVNREEEE